VPNTWDGASVEIGWKISLESGFVGVGISTDVESAGSLVNGVAIVVVGTEIDVDSNGALSVVRLV